MVGAMAEKPHIQGAGSSRVNPRRVVPFMNALREEKLDWAYARGYELSGKQNAQLEQEALELCRGKDAVLFFAGLRDTEEAESYDRQHLELPAIQSALIERIASENQNVVVVLHAGSALTGEEIIAQRFRRAPAVLYEMWLVRRGGEFLAVRDHSAILAPEGDHAIVHLVADDRQNFDLPFVRAVEAGEFALAPGERDLDVAERIEVAARHQVDDALFGVSHPGAFWPRPAVSPERR